MPYLWYRIYYLVYQRPYTNRYEINNLLKSIISNFLLEYVVFLMKYNNCSISPQQGPCKGSRSDNAWDPLQTHWSGDQMRPDQWHLHKDRNHHWKCIWDIRNVRCTRCRWWTHSGVAREPTNVFVGNILLAEWPPAPNALWCILFIVYTLNALRPDICAIPNHHVCIYIYI